MELYGGIDLHSNNSFVVVQDTQYRSQYCRRLPNCLETILAALAPFREEVAPYKGGAAGREDLEEVPGEVYLFRTHPLARQVLVILEERFGG